MPNYPYYNYYPTQYNTFPTQNGVGPTQPTQNPGIVWVQGEAGAKSYLVGAGQSVLLMDSETSAFYIKSTDTSGMPLPLRVFEYKEKTANNTEPKNPALDLSAYVTKEEFKKWADELRQSLKGDYDGEEPFV